MDFQHKLLPGETKLFVSTANLHLSLLFPYNYSTRGSVQPLGIWQRLKTNWWDQKTCFLSRYCLFSCSCPCCLLVPGKFQADGKQFLGNGLEHCAIDLLLSSSPSTLNFISPNLVVIASLQEICQSFGKACVGPKEHIERIS